MNDMGQIIIGNFLSTLSKKERKQLKTTLQVLTKVVNFLSEVMPIMNNFLAYDSFKIYESKAPKKAKKVGKKNVR